MLLKRLETSLYSNATESKPLNIFVWCLFQIDYCKVVFCTSNSDFGTRFHDEALSPILKKIRTFQLMENNENWIGDLKSMFLTID